MPCQVDDSYYRSSSTSYEQAASKFKELADNLTHENDMLREAILKAAETNPELFNKQTLKIVQADQIEHRKEDLKRLKKTFMKSKDAERLGKVMLADPKLPLEPQLGFDPDEF
jgi:hypothetical protein